MLIETQILIMFVTAGGVVAGMASMLAVGLRPKVVEWRLDPPDGEHLLLPSAEPTDEEQGKIDQQKRAEVLYHALVYNGGVVSTTPLYKIIQEQWNKKLEAWPQYKAWKIAHQWLLTNVAAMEFDNGGEVFRIVEGNSAGAVPGYYVLVSPPDPNGKGRKQSRKILAVAELVEMWKTAQIPSTPAPQASTAPAQASTETAESSTDGIQSSTDEVVEDEPLDPEFAPLPEVDLF
jgi:hypothetical protein